MGILSTVTDWLLGVPGEPVQARVDGSLEDLVARMGMTRGNGVWTTPSIREALGVPAIARAVTLISHTTGSLSLDAFRDQALLDEVPRVIARPNPFQTPRDFYRDVAWNMATRGEAVCWIARRDSQGYATALVNVPLRELRVEANTRDQLRPIYIWGQLQSTRYSPATPEGDFVHVTYAVEEPGALRGWGPLQINAAAVSVAVEAQEWAANFYGEGGLPSILIKSAVPLSGMLDDPIGDEEAESEADRLRAQWVNRPNNVPRVIDDTIESVDQLQPNPQGAQMLDARNHQNGDAARMFGVPGSLLEFSVPGSSLTYQNLEGEFTKFVRGCLAISYLEPIEQAFSDLLPRSTVVRFRSSGLYRADAKTRWDIYTSMSTVLGPERAAEIAAVEEGFDPGSREVSPVPAAPPAAIPARLPVEATRAAAPPEPAILARVGDLRCSGMHLKKVGGVSTLRPCGRLLATDGALFVGRCPRCKTAYPAAA